jgi:hypothetical protein
MTRETADEFWGGEVVDLALRDERPDPITRELAQEIGRRFEKLPPGAFRAWTLTQPWPKFCAIVRIISGQALQDELDETARKETDDDDR